MRRAAAAVLSLVLLGACSQEAQSFASPEQVVAALREADLECTGLETEDPTADSAPVDGAERESLIDEQGVCSLAGEPVTVMTFQNEGDREDWTAVGKQLGPVAEGPNWVIASESEEAVQEIADALSASR
jgi:sugar phosphate isomerase/epimerase